MKIAVFAYNFPHPKTQAFLFRLFAEGYNVDTVIAADPVQLNIPPSSVRTKLRHTGLIHPEKVARAIGAQYHVIPHNDEAVIQLVQQRGITLGVIAGARILKAPIIEAFSQGVINFHPGLVPESRGLDAMFWSIYNDIPLGITAHLIDSKIDAGQVLLRHEIPIYADDTALDLAERLIESQQDLLLPAIEKAIAKEYTPVSHDTPYNRKMPVELEAQVMQRLPEYVERYSRKPALI